MKRIYKITLRPGNRHIYIKASNEEKARRIALIEKPISYEDIISVEVI